MKGYNSARMALFLTVVLILSSAVGASAAFSGRDGYGRIGLRAGYPIAFAQPLAGDVFNEGDYFGIFNAALEGGVGFSDYLELTIAVNIELAKWEWVPYPGFGLDMGYGTASAVVGCTGYFIAGDIRPCGRLDLGVSFHLADDDEEAPGYVQSVGLGLGVGVGCQFVFGDIFYLEPYFHWRSHLNGTYEVKFDDPRYRTYKEDYENLPMSLHAGLGFGFLF